VQKDCRQHSKETQSEPNALGTDADTRQGDSTVPDRIDCTTQLNDTGAGMQDVREGLAMHLTTSSVTRPAAQAAVSYHSNKWHAAIK